MKIVVFISPAALFRKLLLVSFREDMDQIDRPINTTVPCPDVNRDQLKTVIKWRTRVRMVLVEVKQDLSSMEEEVKLLTTNLYKNHNRFRNDKGYKTLRMLEKSCSRLLDSQMPTIVTDFIQFLPDSPMNSNLCLPTLSMCQYSLHNLYNSALLLHKIEMLCRKSGLLNMQRLNLGHFWGVAAVNLAVVGRLWLMSRNILIKYHHIYLNLFSISKHLPGSTLETEIFENLMHLIPEDLHSKLDKKDAEVVKDDAVTNVVTVDDFLDLGEPVKRRELTPSNGSEKKPKVDVTSDPTDKKDILSDIHSIEELKEFLRQETELRKTSKKTSLTRKLSQDQWKLLKKQVTDSINPKLPNKSIKNCRKLIRNALKQ